MRDWLIVIIVLLMTGIVLDGLRRMRAARRESIRMSKKVAKLDEAFEGDDDDSVASSEFPSGGARVAGYRDPNLVASLNDNLKQHYEASRQTAGSPKRARDEALVERDLDDDNAESSVPMLMESMLTESASDNKEEIEPFDDDFQDDFGPMPAIGDMVDIDTPEPYFSAFDGAEKPSEDSQQDKGRSYGADTSRSAGSSKPAINKTSSDTSSTSKSQAPVEEVIVMNVMAPEGLAFSGSVLLDVLMEEGLRFGEMDIFHRHLRANGTGEILFSLANMVKPGIFDLAHMDEFETPGVSLFMTLPIETDSLAAFRLLTDTAKNIAEKLGGELKDEQRSVMTQQTIEHHRQRIIEFERRRRLHKVAEY